MEGAICNNQLCPIIGVWDMAALAGWTQESDATIFDPNCISQPEGGKVFVPYSSGWGRAYVAFSLSVVSMW